MVVLWGIFSLSLQIHFLPLSLRPLYPKRLTSADLITQVPLSLSIHLLSSASGRCQQETGRGKERETGVLLLILYCGFIVAVLPLEQLSPIATVLSYFQKLVSPLPSPDLKIVTAPSCCQMLFFIISWCFLYHAHTSESSLVIKYFLVISEYAICSLPGP